MATVLDAKHLPAAPVLGPHLVALVYGRAVFIGARRGVGEPGGGAPRLAPVQGRDGHAGPVSRVDNRQPVERVYPAQPAGVARFPGPALGHPAALRREPYRVAGLNLNAVRADGLGGRALAEQRRQRHPPRAPAVFPPPRPYRGPAPVRHGHDAHAPAVLRPRLAAEGQPTAVPEARPPAALRHDAPGPAQGVQLGGLGLPAFDGPDHLVHLAARAHGVAAVHAGQRLERHRRVAVGAVVLVAGPVDAARDVGAGVLAVLFQHRAMDSDAVLPAPDRGRAAHHGVHQLPAQPLHGGAAVGLVVLVHVRSL